MLTALTIEGFKSHRSSTLDLSDLTVLIGTNASGKSNALEALELLTWIASGRHLSELPYALSADELRIRGSLHDFAPRAAPEAPLVLRATFQEPSPGAWRPALRHLTLCITLAVENGRVKVVDEWLQAPHAPGGMSLYWVEHAAQEGGSELDVRYNNFAKGGRKPSVPAIDQQAVFTQLTTPARLRSGKHKLSAELIPAACEHVRRSLQNTVLLDPVPSKMRDYSYPEETAMQGDGRNLSAVLNALFEDQKIADVLAFVEGLPDQEVVALGIVNGPRGEVMVELYETFGETPTCVEATLLSDGTLRVLAVAATLLSVPAGSLVVIEELDNGVHPSRAEALLRRIEATAKARRLRVLVTTHNPSLMDALSDEAMDHAVVCYREPTTGVSALVRLQDLERYPALVTEGPLGRLVTKGALQRYLPGLEEEAPDAVEFLLDLLQEA